MTSQSNEKNAKKRYPFTSILEKLSLDLNNWDHRPLSEAELQYMFDRFTHIQITTPSDPRLPNYNPPKIVTSQSGWAVLNYGNAISSSPGKYLYNYAGQTQYQDMKKKKQHFNNAEDNDDDEGGTDIGTLSRQRFDTAEDIVQQAIQNGWEVIHIVDGDPTFIWAIWTHAQQNNIAVTGYKFGKAEEERKERIFRSELDDQLIRQGIKRNK